MTMRKYLVTIHEDGSVSAQEFEEPADQEFEEPADQALTNYQAGFRDAVYEILDSLESVKQSFLNKTREYIHCGRMNDAHDEDCKALALYVAITYLQRRYNVFGTRR